jgi:hypothetical protein
MKVLDLSVNDIFLAMSDGERMHMANKLNKEGYQPVKLVEELKVAKVALEGGPKRFGGFKPGELTLLWHGLNTSGGELRELEEKRKSSARYHSQPVLTDEAINESFSLWGEVNDLCVERGLRNFTGRT